MPLLAIYENVYFYMFTPTFKIITIKKVWSSDRWKWQPVTHICIFLIINQFQTFACLLATCMSLLVNFLFTAFANFCPGLFILSVFIYMSYLCIVCTNFCCYLCCKHFLPVCFIYLALFMVSWFLSSWF